MVVKYFLNLFTNGSSCSYFSALSSYTFPVFSCASVVSDKILLINSLTYEKWEIDHTGH